MSSLPRCSSYPIHSHLPFSPICLTYPLSNNANHSIPFNERLCLQLPHTNPIYWSPYQVPCWILSLNLRTFWAENPRYRPECLRLTSATGDLHFASEPGKYVILLVEISLAYCLSKRLDLEICFIGLRAITNTSVKRWSEFSFSKRKICYHIEFYLMTTSLCATDIDTQGVGLVPSTLSHLMSVD